MKKEQNEIVHKKRKNFTMISNTIVDSDISIPAKGVYLVMARKPDKWKFYTNALAKEMKISPAYLRKLLKELHDKKAIINKGQKNKQGIFGSVVYEINHEI